MAASMRGKNTAGLFCDSTALSRRACTAAEGVFACPVPCACKIPTSKNNAAKIARGWRMLSSEARHHLPQCRSGQRQTISAKAPVLAGQRASSASPERLLYATHIFLVAASGLEPLTYGL